MLKLNPNKNHVNKITEAIKEKDFSCCCQIMQNEDSICVTVKKATENNSELPKEIGHDELCGFAKSSNKCICNLYI